MAWNGIIQRLPHGLRFLAVSVTVCANSGVAFAGLLPEDSQRPAVPAIVSVRIPTLEALARDSRTDNEDVSKSLLNSNITGKQTTVTETRLKITPGTNPLQFQLLTRGQIRSETTGINPQAVVSSSGQHQFEIIKPLWFDGSVFRTQKSHGTIQAVQKPTRVRSAAGSRMPLLAPLGDQLAWNQVLRMQPQINQVVAEEVSRDVVPKIDRIVDQRFTELGNRLADLKQSLQRLLPARTSAWHAAASEQVVHLWSEQVRNTSSLRPVAPSTTLPRDDRFPELTEGEDIFVSASDDLLTQALTAVIPTGKHIPDATLSRIRSALQQAKTGDLSDLIQLTQQQAKSVSQDLPTLFSLEFDSRAPADVQCREGQLHLIFRFRIHPKIGQVSGWMTAKIALMGRRLSQESWTVAVTTVDILEQPPASSAGEATLRTPDERAADFVIPGTVAPIPFLKPRTVDDPVTSDEPFTADKPVVRDNPVASDTPARVDTPAQVNGPAIADEPVKSGPSPGAGSFWPSLIQNSLRSSLQTDEPWPLPVEFPGPEIQERETQIRIARIVASRGRLQIVLRLQPLPASSLNP